MARRKRIRSKASLAHHLQEMGHLPKGKGLTDMNESFQDSFMSAIPPAIIQPLGRQPGHNFSIDDQNRLESVLEAFDEGILNNLSPRERLCFSDVIISGDTYDDVAKRYNIVKGAVQTYVKRAAKKIREYIEERDGTDE